jgi:SAM-dependent methyltransferase
MTGEPGPRLFPTFARWWKETVARDGAGSAARQLAGLLWEYLHDSLPDRRRQRYGDAGYDWDYRVDTTSATVGWHDRLLGQFLSAYQPTDPESFHEMLGSLKIDFSAFTFIDLGSGKGRTLLMAADYPFRRVLGVELLPELNRAAQENIRKYHSDSQKCFALESVGGDARNFVFPLQPTVLYLFNPVPEAALIQVVGRLEQSLRECPRPVHVLYHNPLLEHVLAKSQAFLKVGGTHQYSVYLHQG